MIPLQIIQDKKKRYIGNNKKKIELISDHLKSLFYIEETEESSGMEQLLNTSITCKEVSKAIKKLNNKKASGFDEIENEEEVKALIKVKHKANEKPKKQETIRKKNEEKTNTILQ